VNNFPLHVCEASRCVETHQIRNYTRLARFMLFMILASAAECMAMLWHFAIYWIFAFRELITSSPPEHLFLWLASARLVPRWRGTHSASRETNAKPSRRDLSTTYVDVLRYPECAERRATRACAASSRGAV